MTPHTIYDIKQELINLKPVDLSNLCLRLARFKKENKELLTYLLFQAHDEDGYIRMVKQEMDELFQTVNQTQLYFAKKTLRKILRFINKQVRYSGNKQTEAELRVYFCQQLRISGIPYLQNLALSNLYNSQIKKIRNIISLLHEDLQHDYNRQMNELQISQ
jgi:hypothetical protein